MKHFGAVLSGDNNIVDGGESSILTIGTAATNNDSIIIHNEDPADGTALKAITDFGLVIVPTSAVSVTSGAISHLLGADGREVAVSDVGGGINNALHLPISNADGDAFVDSGISQAAVGDNSTITMTGDVVVTGTLQIEGGTTEIESTTVTVNDRFLQVGNTDAGATTTNLTGGIVVETDNDGAGNKIYGGLRYNGASNAWQVSSAPQADGLAGDANWTDLGVAGAGVQSVVGGAGIAVDAADANNPIASVALASLDTSAGATTPVGGLNLNGTGATATIQVGANHIASGHLFTAVDGSVGEALTLANATTGQMSWTALATGTVQKFVATGTKAAADTGFTITAAGAQGHGLTGEDFTITVFESVATGFSQILPESIIIQDGNGGGTAGNVVVTTGATAADLAYKIVIKA